MADKWQLYEPRCPYCTTDQKPLLRNWGYNQQGNEELDVTCRSCGMPFAIRVSALERLQQVHKAKVRWLEELYGDSATDLAEWDIELAEGGDEDDG